MYIRRFYVIGCLKHLLSFTSVFVAKSKRVMHLPKSKLPSTITGGSKCISCLDLPKLGKSCHAKGFVAWTAKICKTFRSSEIR